VEKIVCAQINTLRNAGFDETLHFFLQHFAIAIPFLIADVFHGQVRLYGEGARECSDLVALEKAAVSAQRVNSRRRREARRPRR
jgi:hypothetical protein